MKRIATACLILSVLPFLSGCGVEKEKLYGAWAVEEGPEVTPKGTVWEFGSDGKLKLGAMVDGKPVTEEVGGWSVSGSILTIKKNDKVGKTRVKEITADKLVLKDDEQPKDLILKKVQ